MTNTNTATGAICVYADFRQEAIKPRRTERAQREEIERSLDRLTQQGDFWSLDIIRKAATALADDNAERERTFDLYFLLREVITAHPGEWIIRRRK